MQYFRTLLVFLVVNLTSGDEKTESTIEKNQTFIEKDENLSHVFQVQLELKTTKIEEPLEELEERINKLVQSSFLLANYKHRKEHLPDSLNLPNSDYYTKIIKKRVNGDVTYIHFITYSNTGKPITGEVIADDLNQLNAAQISAELHYPLNRVICEFKNGTWCIGKSAKNTDHFAKANRDIENESGFRWWFIVGVLGVGVIIFLIGWFLLFIYFNSCGASQRNPDDDYLTPAQRAVMPKGIIINPSPPWARGIYDHPLGEPWVDPESSKTESSETNKKQPKYKRSFRTLSEARLEKRLKEEREAITKAIAEMRPKPEVKSDSTPATSSTDTDTNQEESSNNKSKRRLFPAKIAPIPTDNNSAKTTTLINKKKMKKMNEQPEETLEKSHENSGGNEDKNGNTQKKYLGEDIKSEPESDYGSTSTDEDAKLKNLNDSGKYSRPMTAGRHRTSCFQKDNDDVEVKVEQLPKVWTPYSAADSVAMNFWNNNVGYARPSSPTADGIVEIKTRY